MTTSTEEPDVIVNTRIPKEMADELKERAAGEDRSVSAVLRRLIADYLKRRPKAA